MNNLKPLRKLKKDELIPVGVAWLMFILGMLIACGPGGLFLGMSIPILLAACVDRCSIVIYNGRETDND